MKNVISVRPSTYNGFMCYFIYLLFMYYTCKFDSVFRFNAFVTFFMNFRRQLYKMSIKIHSLCNWKVSLKIKLFSSSKNNSRSEKPDQHRSSNVSAFLYDAYRNNYSQNKYLLVEKLKVLSSANHTSILLGKHRKCELFLYHVQYVYGTLIDRI